jgi:hypothetical protein
MLLLMAVPFLASTSFTQGHAIFPASLNLVKTQVVEVQQRDSQIICRFEIRHVYVGDPALHGKSFTLTCRWRHVQIIHGSSSAGDDIVDVRKGTRSIWWVEKRTNARRDRCDRSMTAPRVRTGMATYTLVPTHPISAPAPDNDFYYRAHQGIDCWYADIEAYALIMSRLAQAPSHQQVPLLKKYVESNNSYIASSSLSKLLRILHPGDVVPILRCLATSPHDHEIEWRADARLCALTADWATSPNRMALYERWVTRPEKDRLPTDGSSPYEDVLCSIFKSMYGSLDSVLASERAYPLFLDVLIAGLTSKARSAEFRRELQETAERYNCPRTVAAVKTGFGHLLARMHNESSPSQRQATVQLLVLFLPLQPEQQAALRNLQKELSHAETAARLAAILEENARLWPDCCSADTEKRDKAAARFRASPIQACQFLRAAIRPAAPLSTPVVRQLVADLDADAFGRREEGSRKLARLGPAAEPCLRRIMEESESAEVRRRLSSICEQLATEGRALRSAVLVLARINTPESRALLQELARGAPEVEGTREAIRALERLAVADRARPPKARK